MRKHLAPLALFVLLASVVMAEDTIRTNSGHTMTAGTFGLAYLDPAGSILICDGTNATTALPGDVKAACLTAADLTGDGKHELAFLDPQQRSLFYYNFTQAKRNGPYGSNVSDITAARFAKDEAFDSIVAGTLTRVSFRWYLQVGNQGWPGLPGDLELVAGGEFDTRNRVQEVATVTRGELYTYNPQWSTYKQLMIGSDCKLLSAGELTSSKGDEIVVACGDDHQLTLSQRSKKTPLGRSGVKLTIGKTAAGKVLCTITPQGKIQQYQGADDTWQDTLGDGDATWRDVLLADLDGDGTDELYALPQDDAGTLQRFDPAADKFQAAP